MYAGSISNLDSQAFRTTQGLGDIDWSFLGGNLSGAALLALTAITYFAFFGKGARLERQELAAAKSKYRSEVQKIKGRRKRIPRGVYYVAGE